MEEKNQNLIIKPPVVVILGHIDHGKSSLLEAIRDFKITAKESGGITQHIGAYQIEIEGSFVSKGAGAKRKITFLDTPGHEAFSQMRSRGSKVADIAILVVDAVEGVKSQTKEAILHIKEAEIPAIVALNKVDKTEANPEKVKRELSQNGFLVESLGGKISSIEISAKTKKGIPDLLEMILLLAEMEELKADPQKSGKGVVVESCLDNKRGPTATLLLTDGHLKIGDVIGTDSAFVKIKGMENFQKNSVQKAYSSDPIIVFGFNKAPKVGESFGVFTDLEEASKGVKPFNGRDNKDYVFEKKNEEVLENGNEQRVLNLIIKTDVLGSLEAIEGILKTLPQEKVSLRVLKAEAGNIGESDIKMALGNRAEIFGFKVKIDPVAQKILEREKVRVFLFDVIYNLVEGVRRSMEKILKPEDIRKTLGRAKVLAKFLTDKNRQIIGGKVIEGEIRKGTAIDVLRPVQGSVKNEEKVGQGKMINLQRNKKDANLVSKGDECGILFEGNVAVEQGDILLFYTDEKIKGQL